MIQTRFLFPFCSGFWTTVLFASLASAGEAAWEQAKVTSDGIVVHARQTPGTTVRELKASLIIDAPPSIVLDAACDPNTFASSSEKYVEQNDIFRTADPNVWHNYQLVNFPMVTRRDYTLRYERQMVPQTGLYRLVFRISDEYGPEPKEGVVRVRRAHGQIDIAPLDGGRRSTLRYTLLADPGGNIPAWAINLANRVSLPALIREIRDAAQRRAGIAKEPSERLRREGSRSVW